MRANTLVTGQILFQSNTARSVSMLVEHSVVRMLLVCVVCYSAGVLLLYCYALCQHVRCKGQGSLKLHACSISLLASTI